MRGYAGRAGARARARCDGRPARPRRTAKPPAGPTPADDQRSPTGLEPRHQSPPAARQRLAAAPRTHRRRSARRDRRFGRLVRAAVRSAAAAIAGGVPGLVVDDLSSSTSPRRRSTSLPRAASARACAAAARRVARASAAHEPRAYESSSARSKRVHGAASGMRTTRARADRGRARLLRRRSRDGEQRRSVVARARVERPTSHAAAAITAEATRIRHVIISVWAPSSWPSSRPAAAELKPRHDRVRRSPCRLRPRDPRAACTG